MINENEELMPVPADRAVAAFEQCECFAPETKPIVDEVDRSNARVVREILSQTPNAVNIANSYALANTYKAVGDVALQKMSDGTYSAVLRDSNGRVLEHVKMQKATPEFATAVSLGYSALNAVVGQANMMSIADSLRAIEKELEENKDRDYIQVQGKIDSACRGLSADLAQVEDGQKKPTAVILLNSLREGLMTLKGYIDEEIREMPELTEISFFDNWGLSRSTKPEKAKKRFQYVVKALNPLCRGLVQYAMTEIFLREGENGQAVKLLEEVKGSLDALLESKKIDLVPMIEGAAGGEKVDPVKKMRSLADGLEKASQAIRACVRNAEPERIVIPVKSAYVKEISYGQM